MPVENVSFYGHTEFAFVCRLFGAILMTLPQFLNFLLCDTVPLAGTNKTCEVAISMYVINTECTGLLLYCTLKWWYDFRISRVGN